MYIEEIELINHIDCEAKFFNYVLEYSVFSNALTDHTEQTNQSDLADTFFTNQQVILDWEIYLRETQLLTETCI
jgi:hypothetical protein